MKTREKFSRQKLSIYFHSIRFRLVLWFVLILGFVMLIFSGFIYYRQVQDVRAVAVGRLNVTLERAMGSSGEAEHSIDQPQFAYSYVTGATPNLENNVEVDGVVALQAVDGSILQSVGVLTPQQLNQVNLPLPGWNGVEQIDLPKTIITGNNRFLFINPAIAQNGVISGYLLVGIPLDANDQLGRLFVTLILGNLLTLAVALTGGLWLADQALKPVKTITQTAREISETDLHRRLHLPGQDELTELGNTFDAMLDRLQAAFERQRQFTADASHELRTPLTIIDLETSRMLSTKRSVEEYERVLGTIKSENKFMIRLVTNLLELARMDAGQMSLKSEALDLSDLASEVIERMEPLAKAQGVSVEVSDLPEAYVKGDRSLLTQMLTNLIENGIKYSAGATHPQVRVSVGGKQENGRSLAIVRVSDNGIGIAPEHLRHLCDRFYQVDASRSRKEQSDGEGNQTGSSGTGLGLAIAQWIARAHGGEIHVDSMVGKGSTFEVVIPANYTTS